MTNRSKLRETIMTIIYQITLYKKNNMEYNVDDVIKENLEIDNEFVKDIVYGVVTSFDELTDEANKYLKDWNTFIYGHNMKNGSMFGSLKKLLNDETLYDSDPYIYVYLPGYIYRYKIFSYYKDKPDSKMYWTADTLQEYRQYIRDALSLSVRDLGVETSEENNMVTLVTCSGSGAGKMRFFVHGEFIDRYKIK